MLCFPDTILDALGGAQARIQPQMFEIGVKMCKRASVFCLFLFCFFYLPILEPVQLDLSANTDTGLWLCSTTPNPTKDVNIRKTINQENRVFNWKLKVMDASFDYAVGSCWGFLLTTEMSLG